MSGTRDATWALAVEVSTLAATTLSFVLLGVALKPAGYGAFIAISAVVTPLSAFSNGGNYLALLDHLSRASGPDVPKVASSHVALAIRIGALVTSSALLIVLLTIKSAPVAAVVLICIADLLIASTAMMMVGILQVRRSFTASARPRVLLQISRAVMFVALWRLDLLDFIPYAIAQFALISTFLVGVAILAKRTIPELGRPLRASPGDLRGSLTYSVGISAYSVQNDGDKFALTAYGYPAAAGVYGMGYRVVQLGMLPVGALLAATHLSFFPSVGTVTPLKRARGLARPLIAYTLVACVAIWLLAPLIPQLVGESYAESVTIVRWLLPLLPLRTASTLAMNGVMGLGYNTLRTRVQVLNAAFAVVLYVILVPRYSWQGAAFATIVSETSLCIVGWALLVYLQRAARDDARAGNERADEAHRGSSSKD